MVVKHYLTITCLCFQIQEPRAITQEDFEKVLATSKKTKIAASEFSRLNLQSLGLSRKRDSEDYQVQAAISGLSKLVMSQIANLHSDDNEETEDS